MTITPRDTPAEHILRVNYETGQPITQRQLGWLQTINEAAEQLFLAMHTADGSTPPGEHQEHTWSSRRMSIAATHIETALMYARRAALQT